MSGNPLVRIISEILSANRPLTFNTYVIKPGQNIQFEVFSEEWTTRTLRAKWQEWLARPRIHKICADRTWLWVLKVLDWVQECGNKYIIFLGFQTSGHYLPTPFLSTSYTTKEWIVENQLELWSMLKLPNDPAEKAWSNAWRSKNQPRCRGDWTNSRRRSRNRRERHLSCVNSSSSIGFIWWGWGRFERMGFSIKDI